MQPSSVRSSPSAPPQSGVGGHQQQQVVAALPQNIPSASASATPIVTAFPTNKMNQSCFNCGSTAHSGRECQESSMEDVTRNSIYKLDYTALAAAAAAAAASAAAPPPTVSAIGGAVNATTSAATPVLASSTRQQPPTTSSQQEQINTMVPPTTSSAKSSNSGPKTKPLFNPADIAPRNTDEGEVISLISSDSSNESNSSSK